MFTSHLIQVKEKWQRQWEPALRLWSRFTRLREPRWCLNEVEARELGLQLGFAMIRLRDQAIIINLQEIVVQGLADYPLEVLGHEIGHHILCPADLNDQARLIAYMRRALPGKEAQADMIANLYTDLLINNRLQRGADLKMDAVYRILNQKNPSVSPLWRMVMRMYEILWSLPRGVLAKGSIPPKMESDAYLGSRLIRVYSRRWLSGAGRFAALCLSYLEEQLPQMGRGGLGAWRDTRHAAGGAFPHGLTEIDPEEIEGALHPAFDPEIAGQGPSISPEPPKKPPQGVGKAGLGQHRDPREYGEILKALGLPWDEHQTAIQYYRERARPHLIPYPGREVPESQEPLMEGLEPWVFGEALEKADWVQSVLYSPHVVPGLTTLQRTWGTSPGAQPTREPLDLDLFVDCSGSMPNPQVDVSLTTLAGTIIALSALRASASVQATLWSGFNQYDTTAGFIRDEEKILGILTGYLGGNTHFPLHVLLETYLKDPKPSRPTHILVISDLGVDTMFKDDALGNSPWGLIERVLKTARGGCTFALSIPPNWRRFSKVLVRAESLGIAIHSVNGWGELVKFARAFSRRTYAARQ